MSPYPSIPNLVMLIYSMYICTYFVTVYNFLETMVPFQICSFLYERGIKFRVVSYFGELKYIL